MQGTFFRHVYDSNDSLVLWLSKTGQDSVLTYIQSIGELNKDGYLLMLGPDLTKLPDKPVTSFIIKIEQIDRDTLITLTHSAPQRRYKKYVILNNKL